MKTNLFHNEEPRVMGILNLTPDSFYDGGKHNNEKNILRHCEKMLNDGADIIDIGAVSTRPGAMDVDLKTEENRILPILKTIRKQFPDTLLSIDTYRSEVATKSADLGADIINDISGGTMDADMFRTIAKLDIPYILMHIVGTPKTMQKNPIYKNVFDDVENYFLEKIQTLHQLGFKKIILDPGFGFGKNLEHNYTLMKKLADFNTLNLPILVGISRKSMIYKALNSTPDKALNGTSILNTIALMNGASILRVHDVKEAVECVKLYQLTKNSDIDMQH